MTTSARTPFLISSGLTLTSVFFQHSVGDPILENASQDKPLGRYSKYGDLMGHLVPNGLYILGMGLDGYLRDATHYQNALVMFKATVYAAAICTILKYSVQEKRPGSDNKRSFPSGHSTTAFAFASVAAAYHAWPWGVGAYSIAGLVGYSRLNDNAHYLHDVLAGATIGIGYGLGLYYLANNESSSTAVYLLPTIDGPPHLQVNFSF